MKRWRGPRQQRREEARRGGGPGEAENAAENKAFGHCRLVARRLTEAGIDPRSAGVGIIGEDNGSRAAWGVALKHEADLPVARAVLESLGAEDVEIREHSEMNLVLGFRLPAAEADAVDYLRERSRLASGGNARVTAALLAAGLRVDYLYSRGTLGDTSWVAVVGGRARERAIATRALVRLGATDIEETTHAGRAGVAFRLPSRLTEAGGGPFNVHFDRVSFAEPEPAPTPAAPGPRDALAGAAAALVGARTQEAQTEAGRRLRQALRDRGVDPKGILVGVEDDGLTLVGVGIDDPAQRPVVLELYEALGAVEVFDKEFDYEFEGQPKRRRFLACKFPPAPPPGPEYEGAPERELERELLLRLRSRGAPADAVHVTPGHEAGELLVGVAGLSEPRQHAVAIVELAALGGVDFQAAVDEAAGPLLLCRLRPKPTPFVSLPDTGPKAGPGAEGAGA